MDYEKNFIDFLDKMRGLLDNAKEQGHIIIRVEDLENAFPELAESEDEYVRQTMINFFKSERRKKGIAVLHFGVNIEKMIVWLEKQGDKPKWTEEDSLMIDSIIDTMKWLEGKGATNMKIDWLKSLK